MKQVLNRGTGHFPALFPVHRQLRMFSATRQLQFNIIWPRASIKFDAYAKGWFRRWHVRASLSLTNPSRLVMVSWCVIRLRLHVGSTNKCLTLWGTINIRAGGGGCRRLAHSRWIGGRGDLTSGECIGSERFLSRRGECQACYLRPISVGKKS